MIEPMVCSIVAGILGGIAAVAKLVVDHYYPVVHLPVGDSRSSDDRAHGGAAPTGGRTYDWSVHDDLFIGPGVFDPIGPMGT